MASKHSKVLHATVLIFLVTGLTMTQPATAGGKVELCHLPPDNPDNAHTISVHPRDVDEHLAHGDMLGPCPPTAAEVDPPTVTVDPNLSPPAPSIAGIDGGPARPLARMRSEIGPGYRFDFVENEVYLVTDDPAELADFQSRWPSQVLQQTVLWTQDPALPPTVIYLLEVDPGSANTRRLEKDLARIDGRLHGAHHVSSNAALKLLALVAGETARNGLRVGVNVLLQGADYRQRVSNEAMVGEDQFFGPLAFLYRPNAFEWPYIERRPDITGDGEWPLDTGVGEALRAVQAQGQLGNRVRTLIADGGFYPNRDFPPYTMIGAVRTTNPDPEGCGAGSPPAPDSVCGTHGTHVVMSGFGLPDNDWGTLGPGGAVTDLTLLQSPSIDFGAVGRFITELIPEALEQRPQIINISAGVAIPAGWCALACEPIDAVLNWVNGLGIIVVASAGNHAEDVDAPDEFCAGAICTTFERATWVPCEADHVLCVGAHTFFESRRASYSNHGSHDGDHSVDIFAPGNIYSVDAIKADDTTARIDDLERITGTSFAAPFVSGVAALTWASNPGLSHDQVRRCILDTAHTESFTGDRRRINALGAVSCAMGDTHPWVELLSPADGATYVRGQRALIVQAESDDYEDGAPTIRWTSSLDGAIGTSGSNEVRSFGPAALSIGDHELCANVVDTALFRWRDCVNVSVTTTPPDVEILLPRTLTTFDFSETIHLSAIASDLDGPAPLVTEWRVGGRFDEWDAMSHVSFELNTSIEARDLGVGEYAVRFRATDGSGAFGEAQQRFNVDFIGGNRPPTVEITAPTQGAEYQTDGSPQILQLVASASDREDGAIPFDEITWLVWVNESAASQPLDVTTRVECVIFNPITMVCEREQVTHQIELTPLPGVATTRFDIRGRVVDSDGTANGPHNGWVTVFLKQLL